MADGQRQRPSVTASFALAGAVTVFWLVCSFLFNHNLPRPLPQVHDEFSYLLGADTFAHGRLTNPAPALGQFFESPHILVRPTYASKYPPGQALVLALGQKLFGSPYWGVVIEGAAMVFTFTLMLCAWVELRWAALLACGLALYLQPSMYWVNSYWGGCLAASGEALVLWAIGLHWHKRWVLAGAAFAVGVAVLFWTRPYEGGVASLTSVVLYALALWRSRRPAAFLRTALLGLPILICAIVWTGVDNKAVTGRATLLPYLLHEKTYTVTPVFWFLPLKPEPPYTNPRIAALHGTAGWEAHEWRKARSGTVAMVKHIVTVLGNPVYAIGPVAFLAFLVPFAWRDKRVLLLTGAFLICVVSLIVEVFTMVHYAAPASAVLLLLVASAAETTARRSVRSHRVGFAPFAVLVTLLSGLVVARHLVNRRLPPDQRITEFGQPRADLLAKLSQQSGTQLVFVQYPFPTWTPLYEWVYNGADLDGQKVLFAHDLGTAKDEELIRHYPNRTPWLLQVKNAGAYRISHFPG